MDKVAVLMVILAALAAVPSVTHAQAPYDPTAPLASVAIVSGTSTLVQWIPGPQAPDAYAIIGVKDGTSTTLATTLPTTTQATVPSGFSIYYVEAVTGDDVSPAVVATQVTLLCVGVDFTQTPPEPFIGSGCHVAVGSPKVGVFLP